MPDWSGDFTQDANMNLQVSAVNTTGLKDAAQSYITYILRQVSDWETNAKNIYGIPDAIMAGPRTDGDGNGQIYPLIASNYEYAALMTSHNRGHGSAFCTDNAFGLLGVVTEGLIYSDTGVIELLPALLDSFTEGEITDLMARTNAEVEDLSWNGETVTAKITSNKDNNTIKLMCGEAWSGAAVDGADAEVKTDSNGERYIELTLNKNESKTVVFTRNAIENGTYYLKNTDVDI